MDVSLGT